MNASTARAHGLLADNYNRMVKKLIAIGAHRQYIADVATKRDNMLRPLHAEAIQHETLRNL